LVVFFPRSGVTWVAKGLRAGKKRPLPHNLGEYKIVGAKGRRASDDYRLTRLE
jgi:hypothetical protein